MINVVKRNGSKEPLELNKLHKVVHFACEGINGVSESEIELKAELQFFEGITSEDIQETLIKSTADLISEDTPNYQYVASRLINYDLRKRVYRKFEPDDLIDIVKKNISLGYYEPALLEWFSENEWDIMNRWIKHDRDFDIAYAGMEQFRRKYLIKNKTTGHFFETPQVAMMLIAATGHAFEDPKQRMKLIRDFYTMLSGFDISLPTPVMVGLRSTKRQFASCTLIDVGDSKESINAAASAIVEYAAARAGIGINVGRIRAVGSPVGNGEVTSTGVIPFLKYLVAALKSCNQGGVRSASGNVTFPMWHYEYEDMIVLKNNKGTDETRVRGVDYTVQINKTLLNRLIDGKDITLFSPKDVPGLYDAFFADQQLFEELYEVAEADPTIRKKTITAMDAFSWLLTERKETGRIYIQFTDNTNELGSYNPKTAATVMTNLCVEITEPTIPLNSLFDDKGEIALCTLGAYNFGKIRTPEDFKAPAYALVRFLDNLLTYMKYPVAAAQTSTNKYRNLGIGIVNLAYFLAKHNQKYTDPTTPEFIHPFAEAMTYYTIEASVQLAKERGMCQGYINTKWAQDILPVDKYRKFMDTIVPNNLLMDWESLRKDLALYGIRNASLQAFMPAETSAAVSNSTNGVEPPRALVSYKNSKDGSNGQVVPEMQRLKNKYELLYEQKSPRGYLAIMGVFNKFIDQSISTNTSYNPEFYPDHQIPMSELLSDVIFAYQLGLRTLYYNNENDLAGELDMSDKQLPNRGDFSTDQEYDDACEACRL